MDPGATLAQLGEWELIRRLGAFAPPGQFHDDAALLPAADGSRLVVNSDVLVEGIHFSDVTTAPGDVGWRAAAANLSDLAAMGCTEVLGLTVGLVAPADTTAPAALPFGSWKNGPASSRTAVPRRSVTVVATMPSLALARSAIAARSA